jgi:hypothetical protein
MVDVDGVEVRPFERSNSMPLPLTVATIIHATLLKVGNPPVR